MVEDSIGILETSITVEQGMSVRISLNSLVKGLEYQRVIVTFANDIDYNTPIINIQNGAEIDLVYFRSLIPLELCHIGQPFFVGLFRMELAIQQVFSQMLGILGSSGTAVVAVLHGRPNISGPANTQYSLIIDMDSIVVAQVVVEPPIALIWTF